MRSPEVVANAVAGCRMLARSYMPPVARVLPALRDRDDVHIRSSPPISSFSARIARTGCSPWAWPDDKIAAAAMSA